MTSRAKGGRPTEEEIEEKRRQRAEKKLREAEKAKEQQQQQDVRVDSNMAGLFVQRDWVNVKQSEARGAAGTTQGVRVLSWNILAQGLVRRKLFPGSDCLKWKEREAGLCAEMRSHDWNIAAFQEVDKVEVHGPNLESSGRRYVYSKGYASKQHGLMIAWSVQAEASGAGPSRLAFQPEPVGSKTIFFDKEIIGLREKGRRGLSRVTRNIALFVAIASLHDPSKGVIVATTHLFWHPSHAYERVRQTGILKRALVDWRRENSAWKDWPLVLAGDFNDQPHSATYKLMVGEALTEHNWEEVKTSSVIHKSVDELKDKEALDRAATHSSSGQNGSVEVEETEGEEDEEEEEESEGGGTAQDDQMIKNCRAARPEDDLLTLAELIQLHDLSRDPPDGMQSPPTGDDSGRDLIGEGAKAGLLSAYGSHYGQLEQSQEGNYFGSSNRGRERFDDPDWTPKTSNPHLGQCQEPMWTLHSSIFALTLDYIFLFPDFPAVTALLPTHRTEILAPGVPRKGICASDHVAIGAQIELSL